MVWSNNGDIFDAQYTKAQIDQAPALEAWDFLYKASQLAPRESRRASPPATPGRSPCGSIGDLWYQGNLKTMSFSYSMAPPPAAPKTKKHVFVGNAPGFSVTKDGKNQEEAWVLLKHMVSPDGMKRYFLEANIQPLRKSQTATRISGSPTLASPTPTSCSIWPRNAARTAHPSAHQQLPGPAAGAARGVRGRLAEQAVRQGRGPQGETSVLPPSSRRPRSTSDAGRPRRQPLTAWGTNAIQLRRPVRSRDVPSPDTLTPPPPQCSSVPSPRGAPPLGTSPAIDTGEERSYAGA
jgi:hypothetical protein